MTTSHFDHELSEAIADLIHRAKLHRTCVSCDRFDEPTETCRFYSARPPARVIVEACDNYFEKPPF